MRKVILYGTRTCPYCYKAKKLLRVKHILFNEILIDHDKEQQQEMISRSGRCHVPQIFIGDQHLGSFHNMMELERQGLLDPMLAGKQ